MKNIINKIFLGVCALGLVFGSAFGINALINRNLEHSPVIVDDVVENGIRLRQNKIVASGTDTNILASLTAVVGPSYVYDKTVSWNVAWTTSNSANVNEFVSLSISDDTLTCEVNVLKAFTNNITLTCTANSNESVKATCKLDYVGRTPTSEGSLNCSGDPYNKTILDVLNSKSTNTFSSTGGTLNGSLSHFNYIGMVIHFADGKNYECMDLTKSFGTIIERILENDNYDYTLDEILETLDSTNVQFMGFCNINYNGIKIKEQVSFTLSIPVKNIDAAYFVADSVSLSDTQLIF